MEKATIVVDVKADSGMKSLRQMKMEMKELQIQMTNTTDPTKFKQLEAEFAILRNDMKDTSMAMKYLDPGELLGGWVKMTQGVVGSFAAITGAMSLFGNESEEIQAIEKKSMAIIQVMMGLEQARQLLIDGGGKAEKKTLIQSTAAWLGKTLGIKSATKATAENTTAGAANATMTGVQTAATGGATIATKALGVAMKALPILAIIGGVVALVNVIGGLIGASKKAEQAQRELAAANELYNKSSKDLTDSVNNYIESIRKMEIDHKLAMGEMTQNEYDHAKNTRDMLDSLDEQRLKYTTSLVSSESKANEEREIETNRFNAQMDRIERTDFANEQDRQDARNKAAAKHNANLEQININHLARIKKDKDTYDAAYDEADKKRKADDEEADKRENERKIAEAKRFWDEYNSAYKSWQDKLADIRIGLIEDDKERELAKLSEDKRRQERSVEEYRKKYINDEKVQKLAAETFLAIQEDYLKDVAAINDKYRQKEIQAQIEADKKREEERLKAQKEAADKIAADKQSEADSFVKLIEDEQQRINDIIEDKYGKDVLNNKDSLKEKLQSLKFFHEEGLITEENYLKDITELLKEQVDKYGEYINQIGSNLSSVFSNLTEMVMIEIEKQDYAYQESYENKNTALTESLEKAKEVWGEESKQYKALLEEQKKLDKDKADHDKAIEKQKKDAQNKYAKAQIGIQMVQATVDYAKGMIDATAAMVLNPVWGGIMIGALTAMYGTQMALMAKQMGAVGKMKRGGLITGPSHESGGVMRELEGGEAVINANSMAIPGVRNLASRLNEMGGGTSFGDSSSSPLTIDTDSVATAVINAIQSIPVQVVESDITTTQKRVQVIQNKTSF